MAGDHVLRGFDPDVILALNLAGTFVFGLSGGIAGVRKRLDAFGVVVLAIAVGMAGGIVRDILVKEIPQGLRGGLYAVPALLGAAVVVGASKAGTHSFVFPLLGMLVCFSVRLIGLRRDINLPQRD